MPILVLIAYTLNVLDAGLTAAALRAGLATEGNPLMSALWDFSPYAFMGAKCVGALLGFAILYQFRERPLAKLGVWLSFFAYLLILCVHMRGLHG